MLKTSSFSPPSKSFIENRLLMVAGSFLFTCSTVLTLSPAVRERSWDVEYHWTHWIGFLVWLMIFISIHHQLRKHLPDADPYLLPVASLLTGWGILTIWRLIPAFGGRQTLWLLLGGVVLIVVIRLKPDIKILRKYKYIFLFSGLVITALTLIFGTNPLGGEQRLWLGAFGIYIQPSEPLKLLLIIFLAAYFADRIPFKQRPIALFLPTAVATGMALLLLVVQKDLGTASIFIFLYTSMLFIATGKKRVLLLSLVSSIVAGVIGYFLFDVVRLRIDAWVNPWIDPSGRSYQVVQALLAVANGGVFGRGMGLGNPGLVPVAISDFIFTSIAEEHGLTGTLALLGLLLIFITQGMKTSINSPDRFRRYLSAGLTVYFGAQSILIIGGNLRVLPLTGVTLPFVSYGGSSLLTSLVGLILLLKISNLDTESAPIPDPRPYLMLAGALGFGILAIAMVNGWWAIIRGPDLLTRTDNARRSITDRYVRRGSIIDRNGLLINYTDGASGDLVRYYDYPDIAPATGYINPSYGQAGLESTLDSYLRGLEGYPASRIWMDHLLFGQPPPGLDVRLSIDLSLQTKADSLLGLHKGAIVMINASTGEILVMASHPTYDPSSLDLQATMLIQDPNSPLLNRAAQILYPSDKAAEIFLQAAGLVEVSPTDQIEQLFSILGFFSPPSLRLPVGDPVLAGDQLRVSPLQMAIAASSISNNGTIPAPRIATAVNTPSQGWVILPALGQAIQAIPLDGSQRVAFEQAITNQPFWESVSVESDFENKYTWYLGGTLPGWQGMPVAIVVLLEEDNQLLSQSIGESLLKLAIK